MVHALGEIRRVLGPGGMLVDARPDSRVRAYAEHVAAGRTKVFGVVDTTRTEKANDRAADLAIRSIVRQRLFKRLDAGRFWHRVQFDDLADLRRYLWEHQRFVRRARWVVDAATLRRSAEDPFAIRRPVRYQLFEAV